ncbi:MAG: hypothetical protein Q3971_07345 [Moraxella sp.]|nr:hypothetical protein [Moraxella sp.]
MPNFWAKHIIVPLITNTVGLTPPNKGVSGFTACKACPVGRSKKSITKHAISPDVQLQKPYVIARKFC